MIELLGDKAWAVHADVKTVIHLKENAELDVDAVEKVLTRLKVKHKGIERDDSFIL